MRVPHHVQGPASLTHALRLTHPQKSHALSPGRETARGTPTGSGGRVGWQRYGTHMWAWAPAACSQLEVEPLPLISLWSLRFRGRKFRSAAAPSRPASAASSPQPLPCGPSLGGGGGGSPAPVCGGSSLRSWRGGTCEAEEAWGLAFVAGSSPPSKANAPRSPCLLTLQMPAGFLI